ncbi:MAG: PEP-CTERM sorting domain-containing protein [Opitutales bacterium]|nr:PEP-CTERM sorting domain-containing protein [Opitutales bacterium]
MKNKIRLFCVFAVFAVGTLSAQTAVGTASSNGTIRTGGPTTNPWFHTAQGPGDFASYAISSFSFSAGDFGFGTVTGISAASISYTQSNAAFTNDGPISFHVSFDTTIAGGNYAGLAHTGAGAGVNDGEFSDSPTTQVIGTGTFTEVSSGTVDAYTLDFTGTLESLLVDAINSGSSFSIILATSDPGAAVTYAGIENNTYPDQIDLSITAIPEPSTYAMLAGLAVAAVLLVRRRRR